jgi:hypothetical protein
MKKVYEKSLPNIKKKEGYFALPFLFDEKAITG